MVLPCSPWNLDRCVSPAQAQNLFEAGDWSWRWGWGGVPIVVHAVVVVRPL
ncbi:unnamed protein product, partial [Ectocarpus fasciculatus]